jgi:1-aminocyclopropane-1-carboxylate deaminase/D-cysteine desulfhydrase-like pyridoxal-dependent ACC family enzyme
VWVKRDDLRAPAPGDPYCGNKCRKLHYNLLAARDRGIDHLLSCGGAYSNHIAALASAGRHYGFRTSGIIRGEPVRNPTLDRARADGMQLHFVSRSDYRRRGDPAQQQAWLAHTGAGYWIPEGGTNALALRGCGELYTEICDQLGTPPDYTLAACGTGGTLAGMIRASAGRGQLVGVSVLKGDFLTADVARLLAASGGEQLTNWTVRTDYHGGGYARVPDALYAFLADFLRQHDILPDPVYTGKLFHAAYHLIEQGAFEPGANLVLVHSGGLQGWGGMLGAWKR